MRRALLIMAGAALLTGAAQVALSKERPKPPRATVRLSGYAHGLYPGARKTMTVRIFNRRGFRVRVTAIRAVQRRGRRGCPGWNLSVGRFPASRWDPPVYVPARRSRRVFLDVGLSHRAPDACQQTTFRLRLKARTRPARARAVRR